MQEAHGEYQISVTGNIIHTKMMGSYNEEGAKAYTYEVMKLVKSFDGKPFGIIVDSSEVLGGTPEAYAALDKYNIWMEKNNMAAKALVFNAKIMATILKNQSPSMRADNIGTFTNAETALEWLNKQMLLIEV
ncbi:hypothetical protein [Shewanella maritima]|uniref:hypothetical protein n=1 Tax=Shewanella maritima TaxID=2520507 RepID=UPI003735654E